MNTLAADKKLGPLEKYLTIWIMLCIVLGLLLGSFFPSVGEFLDGLRFAQISIPIGILLFFMMYPTVLGISLGDIRSATQSPKPLLLTIIANWVFAPAIMTIYANFLLAGNPEYIAGVVLLGLSPCTAMVMWWMLLAKGDMAQGLINTTINALIMIFAYAPLAAFYLGISGIPVPWDLIVVSVFFFIVIPVAAGGLTRKILIPKKGFDWFDGVYRKQVGRLSFIALLGTLIVLFSFQGKVILSNPILVARLALPNLLHYGTMIAFTLAISWLANWRYPQAIDTVLIGSSSHFEVAIAVATTLYGINSGAALATVIGPLMEVPLMLSLVYLGLRIQHRFPRKREA